MLLKKSLLKPIVIPLLSDKFVVSSLLLYSSTSQMVQIPMKPTTLVDDFTRFCYHKDLPRAISAMNLLQKYRIQAEPVTYLELIKCCIVNNAVEEGKLIHQHLYSNGSEPKWFLINNLLNMYVKFGLLNEARTLFDEMPVRDVVSWTTIISAYTNRKRNEEALRLLILMHREGVTPNMFTFSSVLRASERLSILRQLHSSIIKNGLDSDVFVRSALVDMYAKCGDLNCGLRVFEEMVTWDLVVWNSIIGAFAQNNDGDEALNLFKRMKRAGFSANQGTLTSVLRACTGMVLLELGRQVHAHVLKLERDLILNNALLDMYCKCGSLEEANYLFEKMSKRDVISWSTMIAGLAQNGHTQEAMELFETMKALGPKPNYITILGVLFACSHAGLVEDGWYYFRSMKKRFGIEPGREHCGCMVDLLGRAGKLDEAAKFITDMKCAPDSVTWKTLLGACRVHRNINLAIHAAQKILELKPDDEGTYVLLSNIYADSHRWEDAEKLRRTMSVRGMKKEPGCSWIEVDKRIHAFVLGDRSHPQRDLISQELNRLFQKITDSGYVANTNYVLHDLEGEQKEDSLRYHSEKLALVFGLLTVAKEKPIRIMKNLRICGDCHTFAKLVAKIENRYIVIRDAVRFHHFRDGDCSCRDYW